MRIPRSLIALGFAVLLAATACRGGDGSSASATTAPAAGCDVRAILIVAKSAIEKEGLVIDRLEVKSCKGGYAHVAASVVSKVGSESAQAYLVATGGKWKVITPPGFGSGVDCTDDVLKAACTALGEL